jgi:uncharacterized membrane protein required for colicin V production
MEIMLAFWLGVVLISTACMALVLAALAGMFLYEQLTQRFGHYFRGNE